MAAFVPRRVDPRQKSSESKLRSRSLLLSSSVELRVSEATPAVEARATPS